jgi:nitrate reductase NapE component
MVLATVVVLFGLAAFFNGGGNAGTGVLAVIEWPVYLLAWSAGLFLTADCLSDEKREGTLGLLFLTDLRGYDVVLGKLCARGMRPLYGLLAVLPVMAVSLLLGGVTAVEFRRVAVMLCNTLFFSLATGICVSAISRDSLKAIAGTLGLLLGFTLVPPWLAVILPPAGSPTLALLSPGFGLLHAGSAAANTFWSSMVCVNLTAWVLLSAACIAASRTWQDREAERSAGKPRKQMAIGFEARREERRQLLELNPAAWLMTREGWLTGATRVGAAALCGLLPLILIVEGESQGTAIVDFWILVVAKQCFELLFAAHICRFYVTALRNGIMALMMSTDLSTRAIVRGHWIALRPLIALSLSPILVLIAATVVLGACSSSTFRSNWPIQTQLVVLACSLLTFIVDLIALGWVAMWTGLTSRRTSFAVLWAVIFTKILAPIVGGFVAVVWMPPAFALAAGRAEWLSQVLLAVFWMSGLLILTAIFRPMVLGYLRQCVLEPDSTVPYFPPPGFPESASQRAQVQLTAP